MNLYHIYLKFDNGDIETLDGVPADRYLMFLEVIDRGGRIFVFDTEQKGRTAVMIRRLVYFQAFLEKENAETAETIPA